MDIRFNELGEPIISDILKEDIAGVLKEYFEDELITLDSHGEAYWIKCHIFTPDKEDLPYLIIFSDEGSIEQYIYQLHRNSVGEIKNTIKRLKAQIVMQKRANKYVIASPIQYSQQHTI